MARDYTNVEVRSILVGLGYLPTSALPGVFPFTTNNSSLTDSATTKAIRSFQEQYKGPNLVVDGIYGNQTKAKLQEVMKILQDQLNIVVQASILPDQPFYGTQTFNAVNAFQSKINIPNPNGIANYNLRVALNQAVTDKLQPILLRNIGKPNYNPSKFPHQDQALIWLQNRLTSGDYSGILTEFARQFRNQTTSDNKPIKLTDVAAFLDGKKFPHQEKALNYLQGQLTSSDLTGFAKRWRNQ
ncbi:MAG TPA: peptidoglycan-binding protein [Candidatus Sericytochromatia bacterium]|jgi:peptidoglycan hydrolase-like protein with peptidoglycan-binding domain